MKTRKLKFLKELLIKSNLEVPSELDVIASKTIKMKDRKIITIGVKNFNMQIDIQKEVEKISVKKQKNQRKSWLR